MKAKLVAFGEIQIEGERCGRDVARGPTSIGRSGKRVT
jgi:hypothetical protein